MRIVYISSSLIPSQTANSVHVMKMCQAFARNGHDVVLIVRSDGQEKTLSEKDVFAYYGVDACFSIQRCWAPPLQTRILYGWGSLRKAKSLAPDLVYSRHYESAVFCARRGFKTIYECHAPPKWKNRLFDQFLRINRWDQSLCRIVVITKSLGEHIAADCSVITHLLQVAPDAADPLPADIPVRGLLPNQNRLQVGYVGSLFPGKGMEVIRALAAHCPWATFHVVGGNHEEVALWKERCGQRDNIHFYGHVHHAEVPGFIKAFDVVLLPNQKVTLPHGGDTKSNIADWTSPLKMFEYMSAGKPIIASDLPVLHEVLQHNRNALLCAPENIEAWGAALERIHAETGLSERLGKNAKAAFEAHYTWQMRANRVIANA